MTLSAQLRCLNYTRLISRGESSLCHADDCYRFVHPSSEARRTTESQVSFCVRSEFPAPTRMRGQDVSLVCSVAGVLPFSFLIYMFFVSSASFFPLPSSSSSLVFFFFFFSVCVSVCLSVCLSLSMSVCLSFFLSLSLSISLSLSPPPPPISLSLSRSLLCQSRSNNYDCDDLCHELLIICLCEFPRSKSDPHFSVDDVHFVLA